MELQNYLKIYKQLYLTLYWPLLEKQLKKIR